jgi:hypothetical protein
MRKLKSKTIRGIRIEADDLVIGLIDRLLKTEGALDSVRKQLNEHFEMIAELQPKLNADGSVSVRAMKIDGDSVEEKTVAFMPIAPSE